MSYEPHKNHNHESVLDKIVFEKYSMKPIFNDEDKKRNSRQESSLKVNKGGLPKERVKITRDSCPYRNCFWFNRFIKSKPGVK